MMEQGYLLAGRYKILDTLGEGGMANVYLADDIILKRKVAVKVLRMDLQNDPSTVRRFQREALATSELTHPNIVNILDVGAEKGMQYLVMEYIDGPNLKQYLKAHYPLKHEEIVNIMDQILSAVSVAHLHNIIHRDLKPQNILVDPSGKIKIADFGIAVALSQQSLTQTNSLLGSVHYMSPEQARGSMATKKSDIYSLGIILYELITGKVPFGGETAVSVALKHFQDEIPSIRKQHPDVPQALENVVLKATAKSPEERYESVDEMKAELDTALDPSRANEAKFVPIHNPNLDETKILPALNGQVTSAKAPDKKKLPLWNSILESMKKHKFWWIFSGIAVLAIVLFLIFALGRNGDVRVPDVTNLTEQEAKAKLESAKLKVGDVDHQASKKVTKGHVIRTIPEKNMLLKAGSEVGLVISSGAGLTTMPDVTGISYTKAKERLEKLGFTVERQNQYSADIRRGDVIAQSLGAGEKVEADQTTVVLSVSMGAKKTSATIKMKDLSGYSEKSARDYASENGLSITVKSAYSDTVEKGEVMAQTPAPGTALKKGDRITVTISQGSNSDSSSSSDNGANSITRQYTVEYDDSTANSQGNHLQVYVQDNTHNLSSVYEETYIKADTNIQVPLSLDKGKTGHVKIVRDGQTIIDEDVKG